jgi:hypothetical protein
MNVPKQFSPEVTLTGYAYETVANKPIRAGQTLDDDATAPTALSTSAPESRLGLLARGAGGLAIWRREEQTITSN